MASTAKATGRRCREARRKRETLAALLVTEAALWRMFGAELDKGRDITPDRVWLSVAGLLSTVRETLEKSDADERRARAAYDAIRRSGDVMTHAWRVWSLEDHTEEERARRGNVVSLDDYRARRAAAKGGA